MDALTERLADLTRAHADFLAIANQLQPRTREQPGVCGEMGGGDTRARRGGG